MEQAATWVAADLHNPGGNHIHGAKLVRPLMQMTLQRCEQSSRWQIGDIQARDLRDVDMARDAMFMQAIRQHTRRSWRPMIAMPLPHMVLAVLHDPHDPLPPSKADSFEHLQQIAKEMLKESEIILLQEFIHTDVDWRTGVLAGQGALPPSTSCMTATGRSSNMRPTASTHRDGCRPHRWQRFPPRC